MDLHCVNIYTGYGKLQKSTCSLSTDLFNDYIWLFYSFEIFNLNQKNNNIITS